jgi:hypothetical protein
MILTLTVAGSVARTSAMASRAPLSLRRYPIFAASDSRPDLAGDPQLEQPGAVSV